jgi:hypothetical protein
MIDATTHTRKIWRSHFDGADSTYYSMMGSSLKTLKPWQETVV